eukprot:scpid79243/ scgid19278/ 
MSFVACCPSPYARPIALNYHIPFIVVCSGRHGRLVGIFRTRTTKAENALVVFQAAVLLSNPSSVLLSRARCTDSAQRCTASYGTYILRSFSVQACHCQPVSRIVWNRDDHRTTLLTEGTLVGILTAVQNIKQEEGSAHLSVQRIARKQCFLNISKKAMFSEY